MSNVNTARQAPWQFGFGQRLPVILQVEAAECGLACVAMVARYHGLETDLAALRRRFPVSPRGVTLKGLGQAAKALKLSGRPLKLDVASIAQLQRPCVLHWDLNHFVVLKHVTRRRIVIHDPAVGVRSFTHEQFAQHFTGIAYELAPAADFEPAKAEHSYSLRSLMGRITGLRRSLLQVLALGIGIEVTAMVAPFYTQLVIDEALVSANYELLTVLGLGFILLVAIRAATSAVRAWVLATLSTNLNFQWLGNVCAHLLKLPQDYFEKRHVGDIVSRFGSVSMIQRTLTTSFVQIIIDGVLVIGTLAMMFVYSAQLGALATAAVLLYALLRWLANGALRNATTEQIVHSAKQQTHFYETARGIQSVRLFGRSEERRLGWLNMLVEQFNAELDIHKINIGYQTANTVIFGIERIAVVWIGAVMVLHKEFTVGMLFAFLAYKDQFTLRVSGLIDKLFELGMLRIHGERVADILFTEPEADLGGAELERDRIAPSITLKNLSYRYSSFDPLVLDNVNLSVAAGECVAITGASGCGKTTLVKLMLGLMAPTHGEIEVGNWPIARLGLANYKQLVGTVMQDDNLFTGSIAENISFFDPLPDQEHIEACAKLAAIHADIVAMPMAYNSLVGNGGGAISGGQKQRVLLARALYSRPKILILDEATSHLDMLNEQLVNDAIKQMRLTRIIIAHRPETIAMASRVIVMEGGRIVRDLAVQGAAAADGG
jgi:ATP-binding cassette subfamily B protein RaxB